MLRRLRERLGRHFWPFALMSAFMTWYAGSKHVVAVWDDAFRDYQADVSTNDWRTVTFAWTPAPGVPGSASAQFWYCDASVFKAGDTNATLTLAGSAAMSARSWVYVAESAPALSNMAWYVKCSYSQGPTVVTNGVYHIACAETNGLALKWVPLGVRVYDGRGVSWRRISPPADVEEPPKSAKTLDVEEVEGGAD